LGRGNILRCLGIERGPDASDGGNSEEYEDEPYSFHHAHRLLHRVKTEHLAGIGVMKADTAQVYGIFPLAEGAVERHVLIGADAGGPVCSACMRQSRFSLASASVERRSGERKPR
jgi:hypothetical protein